MKNWIALSLWRGMTVSRLEKMQRVCEQDDCLFSLSESQWRRFGFSQELLKTRVLPTSAEVSAVMEWLEESGADLLPFTDARYPALLREISSPPVVLYVFGQVEVLTKKQISIVGSRRATPRMLELAYGLASDLVANDVVVTSGLALGIDTAAHRGALDAGGKTVAVMANGLGSVYPLSNASLADRIRENGLLLSEQPPGVGPSAKLFPMRNRIVSGLSRGVVVLQAHVKSGSLITARLALEQNREVMAVPGEAGSAQVGGSHWLLKQGAALVETVEDIYDCLGWERRGVLIRGKEKPSVLLSEKEEALLQCIDSVDTSVEKIYERYRGCKKEVLPVLSQLELSGLVQRTMVGYCRC
jgi:DNA processing protein